jgi:hypothetical protein
LLAAQSLTSKRIQLLTSLTLAECVARLQAAIDSDRTVSFSVRRWFGSKPVIGSVSGTSLRLYKRITYRNSFQSQLTATLQPSADGTVISGTVGMHPVTIVFMILWFGLLSLLGGTVFLVTLRRMLFDEATQPSDAWTGVVIPLLMFAFGIGLVGFGRHLARDEARFLTDFVMRTLKARPTDRGA